MSTWRLAESLVTLRDELNTAVPARSKASDGTKGDSAHAGRASRHNPNSAGVVCAMDVTHDPAHGLDVHALVRQLVRRPHPDLEYVISNGQVAKRSNGFGWQPYTGASAHTQHAHVAVGRGKDDEPTPPYDDTTPWGVAALLGGTVPAPPQEDDDMPMYQLLKRDAGDHGGEIWLVGQGDRVYVDDPKVELPELVAQWGEPVLINDVAWDFVVQTTALNEHGARTIPPDQEARIVKSIVDALKA